MKVFIVWSHASYEPSEIVSMFKAEKPAQALVAKMEAYNATCPQMPPATAPIRELNTFWRREALWKKRHPGGDAAIGCDSYSVQSMDVKPR
jgi:hypothetical protein